MMDADWARVTQEQGESMLEIFGSLAGNGSSIWPRSLRFYSELGRHCLSSLARSFRSRLWVTVTKAVVLGRQMVGCFL